LLAFFYLAPVIPALANEPNIDRWGIQESSDPITDKRLLTAGVGTTDGLILRFDCSGDHFGAVIVPFTPLVKMEFITLDEQSPVIWRVDDLPAEEETWLVTRGRAGSAYAVVSLDAAAFASAVIAGENKLTFRVHGLTTSVTLEGAARNVAKAMDACGIRPQ